MPANLPRDDPNIALNIAIIEAAIAKFLDGERLTPVNIVVAAITAMNTAASMASSGPTKKYVIMEGLRRAIFACDATNDEKFMLTLTLQVAVSNSIDAAYGYGTGLNQPSQVQPRPCCTLQ